MLSDTVGTAYPTTSGYAQTDAVPMGNGTITTISPLGIGNNTQWYYYNDYSLAGRVAGLEGEVRVLRDMVAALLSNKPTPRKRAKKHA